MTLQNVPTWKVMEDVARTQFVQGRWERSGDGYRLVGTAVAALPENRRPPAPAAQELVSRWHLPAGLVVAALVGALGCLAALLGALYAYRRYRGRTSATPTQPGGSR